MNSDSHDPMPDEPIGDPGALLLDLDGPDVLEAQDLEQGHLIQSYIADCAVWHDRVPLGCYGPTPRDLLPDEGGPT
ncbi:hypothetical protein BRD56_10485 [Thermoplasmatales archaeon SW_10_69_26]|nr:MAG: hypothetical protein BRD56_10485 [Thermoplasmatales archaeon SW_10_69_26]